METVDELNVFLDLEECYSWYKLPKLEQIKLQYEYLSCSIDLSIYEMNIRDWKLVTESAEFLTLDEALEKFKEPIKKKSWMCRMMHRWGIKWEWGGRL